MVPCERDRVQMCAFRKPIGVVGLITPWNFPSRDSRVEARAGADLRQHRRDEAGLGRAAERVAHRRGAARSGAARRASSISSPGRRQDRARRSSPPSAVKAVSFTGSCGVGNQLHETASKRRIRIQLEMGGKNPTVVLGRLRFQERRRERRQRRVLLDRPEVHGDQPRDCRGRNLRQVRAGGGRADQEAQGRRRHEAGHRHRAGRRPRRS